ncbi:hypothetical protein ACTXJU_15050 [Glutamicibacter ardleyensis]|uniref:hypothetical protein n=1 Tax=Glutamicibacter ardleyensis TaxID=225894 RepID=UPI003FD4802D
MTNDADKSVNDKISIYTERSTEQKTGGDRSMLPIGDVEIRFTVDEPYSSTAYRMDSEGQNVTKR